MMKRLSSIAAASLVAVTFAAPATAQTYSDSWGSYSGDSCASGSPERSSYDRSRTLQVVGLTSDNRLVCFNEYSPQEARSINFVSNLSGGDTFLIGIDFRVQNRLLYGVGNAGGVYVIDTANAVATLVNRLSVALDGSASYGVDFNPAADRLRITSSKGQNLRHNVNAGGVTVVDGALNYTWEKLMECYYSAEFIPDRLWITGTYQLLMDPGYNADRSGPVHIFSVRVHWVV